jgi:hypothetical protein
MHGAYVSYIAIYGGHIWCLNINGTYINCIHVAHLDGIYRFEKLIVQVYGRFIYMVHTHMCGIHMVHRFMANTY